MHSTATPTVNWPDQRKIARGRVPALATILDPDDGATYAVHALAAAFQPTQRDQKSRERHAVEAPTAYALLTADDLNLTTLHPLRSLINHPAGRDRSGDALACAGRMAREGYSDEQIFGVLMNPRNVVHAHIGDHRDPRYAATRCIETVRAEVKPAPRNSDYGADMPEPAQEPQAFPLADLGLWARTPPTPKAFYMAPFLPRNDVIVITGDGGTNSGGGWHAVDCE